MLYLAGEKPSCFALASVNSTVNPHHLLCVLKMSQSSCEELSTGPKSWAKLEGFGEGEGDG